MKNKTNMKVVAKLAKNFILMASLFLSFTLIASCGDDDEGPVVPDPSTVVAAFSAQVDAADALTYNFTNSSVVNGIVDRTFTSAWDFGGDGTSTEASPSHTFSAEGSYTVTLTVTASDGVVGTATDVIEVTQPRNRFASITDMTGSDTDNDTGELRFEAMDSIRTGRLTFMYRVTEGPSMDIQDGFINLAGITDQATTGDYSIVEVRFKDNATHGFREGASDQTLMDANFPEGMPDVWVPVELSWAADGVTTPTFSLTIGGQVVIADAISTTNGGAGDVDTHLAVTKEGAKNFQWKYNNNGNISDGLFQVDDIVIYSSDSGTETIIFEDDFQGRTAGDNLDGSENEDSPYHPNSRDATVGEEIL